MTDTKPDADAVRFMRVWLEAQAIGHAQTALALLDAQAQEIASYRGLLEVSTALDRDNDRLRTERDAALAEVDAQAQEIARLRAQGGGLTMNEMNGIAGRVQNLRAERDAAQEQVKHLEHRIRSLTEEKNLAIIECDEARAEVKRLTSIINLGQAENLLAERDAALKDAQEMKLALREIEPYWTLFTRGRVWSTAMAGTAAFIRSVLDRAIAEQGDAKEGKSS